jgi:hypothetical protein
MWYDKLLDSIFSHVRDRCGITLTENKLSPLGWTQHQASSGNKSIRKKVRSRVTEINLNRAPLGTILHTEQINVRVSQEAFFGDKVYLLNSADD